MDKWLERFARANFRRSGDTAHDLKTPLNVAVLNLELMRMRIAKLQGESDEKINGYATAIETELRRLARIFDAFFLLSTPPKDEDGPAEIDIAALATEIAEANGYKLDNAARAVAFAHESRMRQALKLFFDAVSKIFHADTSTATMKASDDGFELAISGKPADENFDITKIFKLYYTDPSGSPDLSLAAARLIAETYGGGLSATDERDKVVLRLSIPLGAE